MKEVRFRQHQDWELQHHLQDSKRSLSPIPAGSQCASEMESPPLAKSHSVKSGLVGYMKKFRLWQILHIQIYHNDLHLEWDLQHHLQILKDLHPQYQGQSPSGRGSPLFAKPCTQHEKRASGLQSGTRPEPVVDIEEDYRFPVSVELRKFNFDGKYPNEKVLRRFIRDAGASLQGLQSSGIYLSPRWTIIKGQAILCLKKTNYGINSLTINFTGPQTQHFPDETFLDTPHTPTK